MLGEPAFGAGLPARNAQRVAFLAQERVAAVSRADTLNHQFFREMHDETPRGIKIAHRMQPTNERITGFDMRECARTDARHDAHIGDYIGTVGNFHSGAGIRRAIRSHQVRDDIHRAAAHTPCIKLVD